MNTSPAPAAPLLSVHQLAFSRNDEPVFGPLDFSLGRGETVLVEGDNGSGKTTLLRVLAGMLPATAGDIWFDGQPASRDSRNGRVLWLGHRSGMHASLSAHENLDFLAGLFGRRAGASATAAMARVGIEAWLDEPYANLDRHGIDLVNALVAEHCRAGGAALVTSHGAVQFADTAARRIHLDA